MFYASLQDLIDRRGEGFTSTAGDTDDDQDLNPRAMLAALRDAEGQVNSYVGATGATLPLPGVTDRADPENNENVPSVLRWVTVDIAIFRLTPRPGENTKEIRKRYDDAIAWLEKLVAGEVTLGLPSSVEVSLGSEIYHESNPRVLTRDSLDGLV
jgi:phage gp36-like protein